MPDPADYLGQDLVSLTLDPGSEVSSPRVVVSGHLDESGGFPLRNPVANARPVIGGVEHL